MHVRFSTCRGLPVVEETTGLELASVDRILLNPDTGAVEGFFVMVPGFFTTTEHFLSCSDIRRFGRRIEVRDESVLGPAEDHVRLRTLLADTRTVMGQQMVTEEGCTLGRCFDVQFHSTLFRVEWLFPRRFYFFWGVPVPIRAVLEVRPHAIVVRNLQTLSDETTAVDLLPAVTTPTAV